MPGYINENKKTSRHWFWRLCWQTAGAVGVFFVVVSLFRLSAPEAVPMKEAVRACFTTDADVTPVIEWLNQNDYDEDTNVEVQTPFEYTADAIPANASNY